MSPHSWKILAGSTLIIVVLVMFAGCTGTPAPQSPNPPGNGITSPVPTAYSTTPGTVIAQSNNHFAADLYREINQENSGPGNNIFFSPFSISSALALTYEGAKGTTAGEIRSVFSFPENVSTMRNGFAAVNSGLNERNPGINLSTANALWAEKTATFLPEYTGVAEQYYGANTTSLDFVNQPDASRQTINSWVAARTNNKIQNLLPDGSIDPSTRLVITNAVYFKGTWEKQFDANLTVDTPFTKSDGTAVTAKMMQQTDENAVFPYAETPDLQMLSLPYSASGSSNLSMIVLLPRQNDLSAAGPYLAPSNLSVLEQTSSDRRVDVYIPKFKLETQYSMKKLLSAMGMPTAFSGAADFSGMDGFHDLYISDVYHKAYIEVNEEGTEAAAATGTVMAGMAAPGSEPPVPVFRADHPFLFLIQDNTSGTILFTGRVSDPTSS